MKIYSLEQLVEIAFKDIKKGCFGFNPNECMDVISIYDNATIQPVVMVIKYSTFNLKEFAILAVYYDESDIDGLDYAVVETEYHNLSAKEIRLYESEDTAIKYYYQLADKELRFNGEFTTHQDINLQNNYQCQTEERTNPIKNSMYAVKDYLDMALQSRAMQSLSDVSNDGFRNSTKIGLGLFLVILMLEMISLFKLDMSLFMWLLLPMALILGYIFFTDEYARDLMLGRRN